MRASIGRAYNPVRPVTARHPIKRIVRRQLLQGSLLLRFSLLSILALACIGVALGWLLQRQMEHRALSQQANEVAVVVDGVFSRNLTAHDVAWYNRPSERARWASLAHRLLAADSHLVRIKVWDPTGRVIYSNDPRQIGKRFPIDDELRAALNGRRGMDVSNLSNSENALDRQRFSSLLETYIPLRSDGQVVGAYEAYSDLTELQSELTDSRRVLWGSLVAGFLLLFASLFAIVRSASRRLVRQMHAITALEVQAREAETLRQVDRLKDDFISSVSHELRRPLSSIKGYTASLLLPDARWDADTTREFLQVIDEESDQLAALIDNLLDLARLGSGSLRLTPEPLHLPALTERVVRRIETQSQLPAHQYVMRFPPDFPYVEADQARIEQVLLNLLENAAKYSPEGSPISVVGSVTGEWIEVSVTDRGPGLAPGQAAHVFDRFYRVDTGLTRATEGSGLGLAICRGVLRAHGGDITVHSVPGQGCTFTFRLPVAARPVEELPAAG